MLLETALTIRLFTAHTFGNCEITPDNPNICIGNLNDGEGCWHYMSIDLSTGHMIVNHGPKGSITPHGCPRDADWPAYPYTSLFCLTEIPALPNESAQPEGIQMFEYQHQTDCQIDYSQGLMLLIQDSKDPLKFYVRQNGVRTILHPHECLNGEVQPTVCPNDPQ